MKKDLMKIGQELQHKVPYRSILKEFEVKITDKTYGAKQQKYRLRVGTQTNNYSASLEKHTPPHGWQATLWADVPRPLLRKLTAEITEEARGLIKAMDAFIDNECEAEINETVTDKICGTLKKRTEDDEAVDRYTVFRLAMIDRMQKMSDHFRPSPRPTTFDNFIIYRTFDVPKPADIPQEDWREDQHKVEVTISENGMLLQETPHDLEEAFDVLLVASQIAEFCLKLYSQLAKLAEWEAKNV